MNNQSGSVFGGNGEDKLFIAEKVSVADLLYKEQLWY